MKEVTRYINAGGLMLRAPSTSKVYVEEFVEASDYDELRLTAGGMQMTIWELEDEIKRLRGISFEQIWDIKGVVKS